MSTDANPAPQKVPPAQPLTIRVVSHTPLIYWWPVWLLGFILAGLTYYDDTRLAVVPAGHTVKVIQTDKVYEVTVPDKSSASLAQAAVDTAKGQVAFPVRI